MRYAHGAARLSQLEARAEAGELTLFYGDESHVCQPGYVPYGWQFADEDVLVPAQKGFRLNCWGLFNRDNRAHRATTSQHITAAFVGDKLKELPLQIAAPTVIVLDNASVHTPTLIQQGRQRWAQREMHLFFLPPYSPHLHRSETVWRHLKGGWLQPADYAGANDFPFATNRCLADFGKAPTIKFSPFKSN